MLHLYSSLLISYPYIELGLVDSLSTRAAMKCITGVIHTSHLSLSRDSLWQRQAQTVQNLHRALPEVKQHGSIAQRAGNSKIHAALSYYCIKGGGEYWGLALFFKVHRVKRRETCIWESHSSQWKRTEQRLRIGHGPNTHNI